MRKFFLIAFFLFSFTFASQVLAQEVVDNFQVEIDVNSDASIFVKEIITYNFDDNRRHGIYRDIPINYKARGGNYKLALDVLSVMDQFGKAYKYSINKQGKNLRIKIGDPNKFISGTHTYVITYQVSHAINYFSDHDELYWNVTGNDWDVPINNVSAKINLPNKIGTDEIQYECFRGLYGESDNCKITKIENDSVYFSDFDLLVSEGLTAVVGWPKGLVYEPTTFDRFIKVLKDNYIIFLPFLVIMILVYLWYTRGRDPVGDDTIIPQYEPPDGLTPAEVGAVVDEYVNRRDVISTIIDLCVKGYLRITRFETKKIFGKEVDYKLSLLQEADDSLQPHEKMFLDKMFTDKSKIEPVANYIGDSKPLREVNLSELKYEFYKHLKEIEKSIYSAIVTKKYFLKSPDKVRTTYITTGVIVAIIGFPLSIFHGSLWFVSFIISGILVIIFGFIMPVKTTKGAKARDRILGLKQYLSVAEKDRLKFHNAPQKNPELFEKLLPYAIALKVDNLWADQFKDLYLENPDWYVDDSGVRFNSILFVSSLHNFTNQANTTLGSAPRSASGGSSGFGGGGFSGGGFGGGGGGSW